MPQVVGEVAGRAVPLGRPLGEHLLADPFQLAGDRVVDLPGRTLLGPRDLVQDLRQRLAPERLAAGQELVEDHAEAEHVGPPIDPVPLPPRLLGAHVSGRPGVAGSLTVVLVLQRQPEVGDARLARGVEQDIRGLDVAVDQAPCVGVMEGLGDGRHQLRRFPQRQPPLAYPRGQVAAFDVLRHDVAESVVGPADVVDRDDVRMVEPRERPRLGQVRVHVLRPGDLLGVGHLDGDRSVERVVAGEVDPPETALAEPPDHAVAADRRRVALRGGRGRSRLAVAPGSGDGAIGRLVLARGRRAWGRRAGHTAGRRRRGAVLGRVGRLVHCGILDEGLIGLIHDIRMHCPRIGLPSPVT